LPKLVADCVFYELNAKADSMKFPLLTLFVLGSSLLSQEVIERPREEIQSVISLNLPEIRYAFKKRLVEKEISGTIKLWFALDASGAVSADSIISSTVNDSIFEQTVRLKVRQWLFNPCNCTEPTEIIYPFTFTSFN